MASTTYTIFLMPAEEGGYTVTVPALPAVITEGDTFEESLRNAQEAIELYVEYLRDEGRAVPVESAEMLPRNVQIRVALPAER